MAINNDKYEPVIGLEVHAQLLTESKLFCGCSTKFGNPPNTNTCPVCLGHPGSLPVLNKKALEFIILMGMAINCKINKNSFFSRKNYFYPDLPKGYQISQYEHPVCEDGFINITSADDINKKIGIIRIHLEEDAGKSIHDRGDDTLVDLNRCGVPLIEIVSRPDIGSAGEAYQYLSKIKQIVQYLHICDANMEEGSLRCDANISVRLKGTEKLGTKTELKNMNSFRNVERALEFEIGRQIGVIEEGGSIVQQTLLWNADKNEALPMRSKEEAHDYRYFPDPDLVPLILSGNWVDKIRTGLPEMPEEKEKRFIEYYHLPQYDAAILTQSRELAEYYESVVLHTDDYKTASNWIMGDVLKYLNEMQIDIKDFPIFPAYLAELINLIKDGTISGKIAKEIFSEMLEKKTKASEIIKDKGLLQISDPNAITHIINSILNKHPEELKQYIEGKEKVFGFFIGQIMKESKGKANPKIVNDLLKEKLSSFKAKE